MSPTAAIVIRFVDRSGLGGGGGSAGGSGAGSGVVPIAAGVAGGSSTISGGGVAQPAISKMVRAKAPNESLVTKPDTQYIDVSLSELTANQVEAIEVTGWANADAVIGFIVDGNPLNDRLNPE